MVIAAGEHDIARVGDGERVREVEAAAEHVVGQRREARAVVVGAAVERTVGVHQPIHRALIRRVARGLRLRDAPIDAEIAEAMFAGELQHAELALVPAGGFTIAHLLIGRAARQVEIVAHDLLGFLGAGVDVESGEAHFAFVPADRGAGERIQRDIPRRSEAFLVLAHGEHAALRRADAALGMLGAPGTVITAHADQTDIEAAHIEGRAGADFGFAIGPDVVLLLDHRERRVHEALTDLFEVGGGEVHVGNERVLRDGRGQRAWNVA